MPEFFRGVNPQLNGFIRTRERQKAGMRRQINAADAEIDLLVYDLYGLTAEEIAIVEGQK